MCMYLALTLKHAVEFSSFGCVPHIHQTHNQAQFPLGATRSTLLCLVERSQIRSFSAGLVELFCRFSDSSNITCRRSVRQTRGFLETRS